MFGLRFDDGKVDILRSLKSIFEDILVNFEINGIQPILDWSYTKLYQIKIIY